ncbi:hypothetical protein BTH42_19400 [Burkholderia sp. SRS-W-2-2016]|uniref:hypothetical protein n=1 Tax=Burkholderia sp. SRS-W-2-2016 TaxID=1926878 RepID=UPI00094B03C7|nr:hypothetical protein [Burkholderia sp. SRS-W-2-2016]OLL29990.1 hypothetical protein BTH42_19400 [Burkholderia sp. SRS-W-2-2016]
MSKLFNLKKWVTLSDAAKHLSAIFGEEVAEADILQFALERRLTLSINFVNGARARCARIVGPEGIEWRELPSLESIPGLESVPGHEGAAPVLYMRSLQLHEDREEYINLSAEVTKIDGVWDLPLLGNDRLDVEHGFQMLIGGHAVTSTNLEGAFVQRGDLVCQLQESMDDNEFQPGSTAALTELKQFIAEKKLPAVEGEALLREHAEERKKYLAKRQERPAQEDYYPAGGLPADCNLVVRTVNLTSFIQGVNASPDEATSALSNRERDSLQKQIAALALALAARSSRYKNGERPNGNQIAEAVSEILEALPDARTHGVGKSALRASIKAGIDLLTR